MSVEETTYFGSAFSRSASWPSAVGFGPSRDELYRHEHIFRRIDRPSRLVLDTTESRPDGSSVVYETEFILAERDGTTLMTMIHHGLPTAELREEHLAGVPPAFARLKQAIEKSVR